MRAFVYQLIFWTVEYTPEVIKPLRAKLIDNGEPLNRWHCLCHHFKKKDKSDML